MFGMGFTEIMIIAVVAILFLGPDKLPSAMVEIAKFFKNTKNAINSVKDTIEEEISVKDMKEEALAYKKELLEAGDSVRSATDIKKMAAELTTLELESDFKDDGFYDKEKESDNKPEEITIKKKKKNKTVEEDDKDV